MKKEKQFECTVLTNEKQKYSSKAEPYSIRVKADDESDAEYKAGHYFMSQLENHACIYDMKIKKV